jgi:hypothetical protein
MAYVRVIVRHPNGEEYEAEVDTESQPEALLASLVENLGLDTKATRYRFQLVNATKIEEGVIPIAVPKTMKYNMGDPSPLEVRDERTPITDRLAGR